MDSRDFAEVRQTLWATADQFRANSTLAPSKYRGSVLELIFLAYAEHRFDEVRLEIEARATARRPVSFAPPGPTYDVSDLTRSIKKSISESLCLEAMDANWSWISSNASTRSGSK